MKFKQILLICLFLAILSIGGVTASDDLDVNGTLQASDSDSSDLLADGSYYGNDFYITVQENYTHDKSNWESRELIYISSSSNDNTTLSILVDDVEKQSLNVTDGYFSVEDNGYGGTYNKYYACIYPTDLGLDCGSYNIKVKSNGNAIVDSKVTIKEKDDFDIWMQNPYYCEQEYWSSPSFIVIDSNHLTNGSIEILVNGTRKLNYTVTNGNFEAIEGCSNKSRYVAPSDLVSTYGTYNIKITFTQNGVTNTLRDEKVILAEFEPTTNPKLDLYFDFYTLTLPADNIARIYLPREATGNLTISYNNVINKTVKYSKGYGEDYMESWNLNHLGENIITVTYTGDDFGILTATGSIIVIPAITAPSYVSVGEKFYISMLTHDWVGGMFNVYNYTGDVKGNLLGSNTIFKRVGSDFATSWVYLTCNDVGLNKFYLEFDYIGGDCPLIQEINVIENSENVSVSVPISVEKGDDLIVNMTAPASPYNFAYVSADDGQVNILSMETGEISQVFSSLSLGEHSIYVKYDGRTWDANGNYVGDIYSNTFIVNVGYKTEIMAEDINTSYKSPKDLIILLKDSQGNVLSGKNITVKLNGTTYTNITDENGRAVLTVDLEAGNYTAEIIFNGSYGYLACNATSKIVVSQLKTQLSANNVTMRYLGSDQMTATLKDSDGNPIAGQDVYFDVGGTLYSKTTDDKGNALLSFLENSGNYTVDIFYLGDRNYMASKASSKLVINRIKTQLFADDISVVYGTSTKLVVSLKNDLGFGVIHKDILVRLNGMNYTNITDFDGQISIPVSFDAGDYVADIIFEGTRNYVASNASCKVSISKLSTKIIAQDVNIKYGSQVNYVILLKDGNDRILPEKQISISINGENYTRITDGNGEASIVLDLPAGNYPINIAYAGDNNFISSAGQYAVAVDKVNTALNAPQVSTVYNIAKNLVITLNSEDGKILAGKTITVVLKGKNYTKQVDNKGQVKLSVNLPANKYTANIAFAGDENYTGCAKNTKVIVSKATPKIIASKKTFKLKAKTKKVTATLKDNKGRVMKNTNLKLTVKGKTYSAKTNSKGVATFTVKLTKTGTFKGTVKFKQNSNYNAASKSVTIVVKK